MSEQDEALRLAALCDTGALINTEWDDVAGELRRLHAEVNEQARLNGMGAERELALMAKVKQLERRIQASTHARHQAQEVLYAERDRCVKEVQRLQAEIGRLSACHSQNETCALQESLSLVAAPQAWSPAYTRGPARQSAPVAATSAMVPMHSDAIGELAEKYAYRDFTNDYLQVVDDLVRDVEARHGIGLTVGDGGAKS